MKPTWLSSSSLGSCGGLGFRGLGGLGTCGGNGEESENNARFPKPWTQNVNPIDQALGSIPHAVLDTTRDYCRYIKASIISY